MISFEPELASAPDAARLMAIERREIVPVGRELRALAWCGVMLIATGVGIIIKNHIHEIGPLAIAIFIAAAAAACYGIAVWWRTAGPWVDYVVLLGALLISADVAFIEAQWHLLGGEWQRHLLLLAVAHAIAAYVFGSRAVLSLAVAAFAAWMRIEQRSVFQSDIDLAIRAFLCAGSLGIFRAMNRKAEFNPVFDHFATNIAFWGALVLTSNDDTRFVGLLLAVVLAGASLAYGLRRRLEPFVIYAIVYALIAVDILIFDLLHEEVLTAFYLVVSTVAAITGLIVLHFRFRRAS